MFRAVGGLLPSSGAFLRFCNFGDPPYAFFFSLGNGSTNIFSHHNPQWHLVAEYHEALVCLPTFMAVRRVAFSLVSLYQAVWNNDFMNTITWCRCQKNQFCSPLVPGGLSEVRGTIRERDKKRVILARTSSPAGFSMWLHKHLCPHKAGRARKGWNKWSGWRKMRMFHLLTPQDWIVCEPVVKVPYW